MLSHFSHVWLFATPWTVAHLAPLSMGFSRQEYWSGLPCPPSWDLPNPGIEPVSLMSSALAGKFFTTSTTWKAPKYSQYDSSFTKFKHMKTHNIVFKEKWIGGKMTKKSKGMLSQKSGGVCLWIKREGIQKALATWCEEPIHWKRLWCWQRLKAGEEGDDRGWDGWMASPTWWTWIWANSGDTEGRGSLVCCSPRGCRGGHNWATEQ